MKLTRKHNNVAVNTILISRWPFAAAPWPWMNLSLGLLGILAQQTPSYADTSGITGSRDLGTRVNGLVGGRCAVGECSITGGTASGPNLFHRFLHFDTRGGISRVKIQNNSSPNVIVGVLSPLGSFIDKPVALSSRGSLVWLSPGGISLSGGASFPNVDRLQLTTATSLGLGADVFDVWKTTSRDAARFSAEPSFKYTDLITDPSTLSHLQIAGNGDITVAGGLLTIDRELLIDSQQGDLAVLSTGLSAPGGNISVLSNNLSVENSVIDVSSWDALPPGQINLRAANRLTLRQSVLQAAGNFPNSTGGNVTVLGGTTSVFGSRLSADGASGGGSVYIGGGYQGALLNKRSSNSLYTNVDQASYLTANALVNGNGGEVIVWSDQDTWFAGSLQAKGGPEGGNGGLLEVSGKVRLGFQGQADASAPKGAPGRLLLDPRDLYVINPADPSFATLLSVLDPSGNGPCQPGTAPAGPPSCTAIPTSQDYYVDATSVASTLLAGTNVDIATNRDIYILSPIDASGSSLGSLAILSGFPTSSSGNVIVNAPLNVGGNAPTTPGGGIVINAFDGAGSISNQGVSVSSGFPVSTGTSTPVEIIAGTGGIDLLGDVNFQDVILQTPNGPGTMNPGFISWTGNTFVFTATGGPNLAEIIASVPAPSIDVDISLDYSPTISLGPSSLGSSINIAGSISSPVNIVSYGGAIVIGGAGSLLNIDSANINTPLTTISTTFPSPGSATLSGSISLGSVNLGASIIQIQNSNILSPFGLLDVGGVNTTTVTIGPSDITVSGFSGSTLYVKGSNISLNSVNVNAQGGGSISVGDANTTSVTISGGTYTGLPSASTFVAQGQIVNVIPLSATPPFTVVTNPAPTPPSPTPTPAPPEPTPPPPEPTPPPPEPTPPPPEPTPPPPEPTPAPPEPTPPPPEPTPAPPEPTPPPPEPTPPPPEPTPPPPEPTPAPPEPTPTPPPPAPTPAQSSILSEPEQLVLQTFTAPVIPASSPRPTSPKSAVKKVDADESDLQRPSPSADADSNTDIESSLSNSDGFPPQAAGNQAISAQSTPSADAPLNSVGIVPLQSVQVSTSLQDSQSRSTSELKALIPGLGPVKGAPANLTPAVLRQMLNEATQGISGQ